MEASGCSQTSLTSYWTAHSWVNTLYSFIHVLMFSIGIFRIDTCSLTANILVWQVSPICNTIFWQYQEEVGELNETARQRPHTVLVAGIQQENRHLRELQQENRELRAALEEHQNALELIMSKYRQQVTKLVSSSKQDLTSVNANNKYSQVSTLWINLLAPELFFLNFSTSYI